MINPICLTWVYYGYFSQRDPCENARFLALLQKIRRAVPYGVFQGRSSMSDFKWSQFRGEIILSCVRSYCKYGLSYRDLAEMILKGGSPQRAIPKPPNGSWAKALKSMKSWAHPVLSVPTRLPLTGLRLPNKSGRKASAGHRASAGQILE